MTPKKKKRTGADGARKRLSSFCGVSGATAQNLLPAAPVATRQAHAHTEPHLVRLAGPRPITMAAANLNGV